MLDNTIRYKHKHHPSDKMENTTETTSAKVMQIPTMNNLKYFLTGLALHPKQILMLQRILLTRKCNIDSLMVFYSQPRWASRGLEILKVYGLVTGMKILLPTPYLLDKVGIMPDDYWNEKIILEVGQDGT